MENSTATKIKDMIVILPEKEIIARVYPDVERTILNDIVTGDKVVINMENVNFVDNHGIVFLLRVRELVEMKRGHFSMYNLNRNVERMIRRLQLDKILNAYGDAESCFQKMLDDNMRTVRTDSPEDRAAEPQARKIPVSVS